MKITCNRKDGTCFLRNDSVVNDRLVTLIDGDDDINEDANEQLDVIFLLNYGHATSDFNEQFIFENPTILKDAENGTFSNTTKRLLG